MSHLTSQQVKEHQETSERNNQILDIFYKTALAYQVKIGASDNIIAEDRAEITGDIPQYELTHKCSAGHLYDRNNAAVRMLGSKVVESMRFKITMAQRTAHRQGSNIIIDSDTLAEKLAAYLAETPRVPGTYKNNKGTRLSGKAQVFLGAIFSRGDDSRITPEIRACYKSPPGMMIPKYRDEFATTIDKNLKRIIEEHVKSARVSAVIAPATPPGSPPLIPAAAPDTASTYVAQLTRTDGVGREGWKRRSTTAGTRKPGLPPQEFASDWPGGSEVRIAGTWAGGQTDESGDTVKNPLLAGSVNSRSAGGRRK